MYKIVLKKKAKKFIDKLSLDEKKRIVSALEKLPHTGDKNRLKGTTKCIDFVSEITDIP